MGEHIYIYICVCVCACVCVYVYIWKFVLNARQHSLANCKARRSSSRRAKKVIVGKKEVLSPLNTSTRLAASSPAFDQADPPTGARHVFERVVVHLSTAHIAL